MTKEPHRLKITVHREGGEVVATWAGAARRGQTAGEALAQVAELIDGLSEAWQEDLQDPFSAFSR